MSEVNRHIEEIEKKLKPIIDLFKHSDYTKKELKKNEPKFRIGDWCIDNQDGTVFQIVKVLDNTYTYKTNVGKEYSCTHYSLEIDAKLWTIQDAKAGDVLVYDNGCVEIILLFKKWRNGVGKGAYSYAYITSSRHHIQTNHWSDCGLSAHPATKEQRDQLEKAMAYAGYTFDFEKKELKEINDKFNFSRMKAFTPVLARTGDHQTWFPHFFESYHPDSHGGEFYMIDEQHTLIRYSQCVPYEGNEKLLRTQDPIPPFYDIRKK